MDRLNQELVRGLLADDRQAQIIISQRWRKVLTLHRRMQRSEYNFQIISPALLTLYRRQLELLAELLSVLSQTEVELQSQQDQLP